MTRAMICSRCGEPVAKDWSGWHHNITRPMSAQERRKFRHVVKPEAKQ